MYIKIYIDLGKWEIVKKQLSNNEIDGLLAMGYSQEREKDVNFSVPYSYISHSIFVRKDNKKIKSLKDIINKDIIVIKDDIMHNNITNNIFLVENYSVAIKILASGKYDCALINKVQGQYAINKLKLANINSIPTGINSQQMCFAINKNNFELLGIINEGLQVLKSTGKYQEIYDKWFSIYEKKSVRKKVIKIITYILSPIFLLLILAFFWNQSLQKLVTKKTSQILKELNEKEKISKELSIEKSLIHSMINSIPDLIFYKDINNKYLGCNEAFAKFNGKTIEDIIEMKTDELFPFNKVNKYLDFDKLVLKQKNKKRYESLEKDMQGNTYLFEIQITPFVNIKGEAIGVVGICRDITNRHKTELALKNAKEKLKHRIS
jgi:PAS domain S-box-containing protein